MVSPRLPEGVVHQVALSGSSRPVSAVSVSAGPMRAGPGGPVTAVSAWVRDQAAARALRTVASSTASSCSASARSLPAAEVSSRDSRGSPSRRLTWARRSRSAALRGPACEIPAETMVSIAVVIVERASRWRSLRVVASSGHGQGRPARAKSRMTDWRRQAALAVGEWRPETIMPRGPSPAITTTSGAPGQVMLRRPGALVTSVPVASRAGSRPARDACTRRRASAPRDFSTQAGSQASTSSRTGSLPLSWAGASGGRVPVGRA